MVCTVQCFFEVKVWELGGWEVFYVAILIHALCTNYIIGTEIAKCIVLKTSKSEVHSKVNYFLSVFILGCRQKVLSIEFQLNFPLSHRQLQAGMNYRKLKFSTNFSHRVAASLSHCPQIPNYIVFSSHQVSLQ